MQMFRNHYFWAINSELVNQNCNFYDKMVLRHVLYRYFAPRIQISTKLLFLDIFGHFWWFFQGSSLWNVKNPIQILLRFSAKKKWTFFVHVFARVSTYLYFSRPILIIPSLYLKFQLEIMISEGVARMDRQTDRHTHRQTDRQTVVLL